MSEFSFANYGELKEAMADWLMRQDLNARIPQFLRMAEAELDTVLRVREMIGRARTVAECQYIALPDDWVKARNVQRVSDGEPLGLMAYDEIDRYRADIKAGRTYVDGRGPRFYALVGEAMELAPAPPEESPAEIELIYYRRVPRPSSDTQRTWLLDRYPSVYLYGGLVHSAPFLKDDERLAVWQALYQNAVASANQSDADARYSGAPMVRRSSGFGV